MIGVAAAGSSLCPVIRLGRRVSLSQQVTLGLGLVLSLCSMTWMIARHLCDVIDYINVVVYRLVAALRTIVLSWTTDRPFLRDVDEGLVAHTRRHAQVIQKTRSRGSLIRPRVICLVGLRVPPHIVFTAWHELCVGTEHIVLSPA